MITYFVQNWKLGVHLLFRTRRFGVNNKWTAPFDSLFGVSRKRIICDILTVRPILRNHKMMRFRAIECGFVPGEESRMLWPGRYRELRGKQKGITDEKGVSR